MIYIEICYMIPSKSVYTAFPPLNVPRPSAAGGARGRSAPHTDTQLVPPDALVVVPVPPPQAVRPCVQVSIVQAQRETLGRTNDGGGELVGGKSCFRESFGILVVVSPLRTANNPFLNQGLSFSGISEGRTQEA